MVNNFNRLILVGSDGLQKLAQAVKQAYNGYYVAVITVDAEDCAQQAAIFEPSRITEIFGSKHLFRGRNCDSLTKKKVQALLMKRKQHKFTSNFVCSVYSEEAAKDICGKENVQFETYNLQQSDIYGSQGKHELGQFVYKVIPGQAVCGDAGGLMASIEPQKIADDIAEWQKVEKRW